MIKPRIIVTGATGPDSEVWRREHGIGGLCDECLGHQKEYYSYRTGRSTAGGNEREN